MRNARPQGFTLVELMVTVVVLAIIVGIAYPSYRNYTVQTRRSDAQIGLTRMANLQEKFFSACNQYTSTHTGAISGCTGLGYTTAANALSPERHYRLTIDTSGATCPGGADTCYVITADPDHASTTRLNAGNGDLRINANGIKEWDRANNGTFTAKWTDK